MTENINYVIKVKGNHFSKFISDLFMMTYIVGRILNGGCNEFMSGFGFLIHVYVVRQRHRKPHDRVEQLSKSAFCKLRNLDKNC